MTRYYLEHAKPGPKSALDIIDDPIPSLQKTLGSGTVSTTRFHRLSSTSSLAFTCWGLGTKHSIEFFSGAILGIIGSVMRTLPPEGEDIN